MDMSKHLEHLRHVGILFAIVVREHGSEEEQAVRTSGEETTSEANERVTITGDPTKPASTTTLSASTLPPEQRNQAGETKVQYLHEPQQQGGAQMVQEIDHEDDGQNLDCVERVTVQTQEGFELVDLNASVTVMKAKAFCRRWQSLAHLLYRGLETVYRHARDGGRHSFVWECAADIGRIKQLASSTSACDGGSIGTGIIPFSRGEQDISQLSSGSDIFVTGNNSHSTSSTSSSKKDGSLAEGGGCTDEVDIEFDIETTRAAVSPEAAGSRETTRAA